MSINYYLNTSLGAGKHIGRVYSLGKDDEYAWQWAIEPNRMHDLKERDVIIDDNGDKYSVIQMMKIIQDASIVSTALIGQEFW